MQSDEVEFKVYCSRCKSLLEIDEMIYTGRLLSMTIKVEPCPDCLKQAEMEATEKETE